jgi:hypothetical protein
MPIVLGERRNFLHQGAMRFAPRVDVKTWLCTYQEYTGKTPSGYLRCRVQFLPRYSQKETCIT